MSVELAPASKVRVAIVRLLTLTSAVWPAKFRLEDMVTPVFPVLLIMLRMVLPTPSMPRRVSVPVVSAPSKITEPPERMPDPAEPMLMVVALMRLAPLPKVRTCVVLPPLLSPIRKFPTVMVLDDASFKVEGMGEFEPVVESPRRKVPLAL